MDNMNDQGGAVCNIAYSSPRKVFRYKLRIREK